MCPTIDEMRLRDERCHFLQSSVTRSVRLLGYWDVVVPTSMRARTGRHLSDLCRTPNSSHQNGVVPVSLPGPSPFFHTINYFVGACACSGIPSCTASAPTTKITAVSLFGSALISFIPQLPSPRSVAEFWNACLGRIASHRLAEVS